jgi:hypothetical protein
VKAVKKKRDDGVRIDIKQMRYGRATNRFDWKPTNGRLGDRREDGAHAPAWSNSTPAAVSIVKRWPADPANGPLCYPGHGLGETYTASSPAGKIAPAIEPNWRPKNGHGFREQIKGGEQFPPHRKPDIFK